MSKQGPYRKTSCPYSTLNCNKWSMNVMIKGLFNNSFNNNYQSILTCYCLVASMKKKKCSYSCIFIGVEVLEESFTRSIVIDWYRLKKQVLIFWNYISLYLSSNKFCLECIESMSWWVSESSYYILLRLGSWVYFMIENMNNIKSEAFLTFTRKIRPT